MPVKLAEVRPEECGWLPRPDLDVDTFRVWELPDGTLCAADPDHPMRLIKVLGHLAEDSLG